MLKEHKEDLKSAAHVFARGIASGEAFNPVAFAQELRPILMPIIHANRRTVYGLFGLAVIFGLLRSATGSTPLSILILAFVLGILLTQPKPRKFLFSLLNRHTPTSDYEAILGAVFEEPPRIVSFEDNGTSINMAVQMRPMHKFADLERSLEPFSIGFEFGSARVVRDPSNASIAKFKFVRGAPLSGRMLEFPGDASSETSLWDRIPVGIDEDGQLIEVYLPENTLLIGGEPGGGKTVFATILLMFIICCPNVELYIFDGKEIDLVAYARICKRFVGCDIARAIEVLEQLRSIMAKRYVELRRLGLKKISPGCGINHIVVLIDELAFYIASGKEGKAFAEALRDLIARARAAGIVVILTTQKPSSDTVPTAIRDLISLRVAFRCGSIDASATILGQGWAGEGFSASTIPHSDRGVGYLLAEAGIPQLFRSYYVTPEQEALAIRAACAMRGQDPDAPLGLDDNDPGLSDFDEEFEGGDE